MYENNFFNTGFSTSNPFSNVGNKADPLMDAYAKLEALKQQQMALNDRNNQNNNQYQQTQSNVFSDISNEFKDMSENETKFVLSSKEYIDAYNNYQTKFSEFITAKFANEFLQSGNGRCAEELLFTIKQQKEAYKGKFAKDISEIQEQNKNLANTNSKLIESNAELQKQLLEIQKKLTNER